MEDKRYENLRKGERAAYISISAYLLLSILKLWIGEMSNSEALKADGLNNATDIVASIAVLIGLRVSQKPPDKDHPYGHWKAETVAAMIASFIMMVVGIQVLYGAIINIFQTEQETYSVHIFPAIPEKLLVEITSKEGDIMLVPEEMFRTYDDPESFQLLEEMGPHYLSGAVLLRPVDPPKGPLWKQAMGIRPDDPIEVPQRPDAAGKAAYADSDKKEESPKRITKPFRKRTAPESAPVESEDDTPMPEDGASAESSDKEPRKRSWLWPAPRRLPEEVDTDAKKLEANEPSGKADLID